MVAKVAKLAALGLLPTLDPPAKCRGVYAGELPAALLLIPRFESCKFPVFYGVQRRPDSTRLRPPPTSLANCGTAETGEIFRAVGGVLQE